MNPVISVIVSLVSGGLAGAFVGHWLVVWREKACRRLAFRNILAVLIAELQDTAEDGVSHYASSRRTVLVECAKIEADIGQSKRSDFKCARREYCGLEQSEQKREKQAFMHQVAQSADLAANYPPPAGDSRTVKQKMIAALQKLKDCAE